MTIAYNYETEREEYHSGTGLHPFKPTDNFHKPPPSASDLEQFHDVAFLHRHLRVSHRAIVRQRYEFMTLQGEKQTVSSCPKSPQLSSLAYRQHAILPVRELVLTVGVVRAPGVRFLIVVLRRGRGNARRTHHAVLVQVHVRDAGDDVLLVADRMVLDGVATAAAATWGWLLLVAAKRPIRCSVHRRRYVPGGRVPQGSVGI